MGDRGFTLVEVILGVALIAIGLVAVAMGFPLALSGVDKGKQQSAATFLAEQRLEQIKAWAVSPSAGQGFTTIATGNPCCQNQNPIPGYATYSRTVNVTNPTPTTKLVQVTVSYRPLTGAGTLGGLNQVILSTLIASR